MKTRMYWRYATRSLTRGGQRTLLAIFCIAVGVLAVVSLQLVGNMVNHALTDNVRAANGGDLYVWSAAGELPASDLAAFARLKSEGVLTEIHRDVRHQRQHKRQSGCRPLVAGLGCGSGGIPASRHSSVC